MPTNVDQSTWRHECIFVVSKSPRSISCSPSVIVWVGDSDLKIYCCWWLTFRPPVVIFSKVKAVDSKLQYKGMPLARRFQLGSLRLLSNFNAIYLFVYRFTQLKLVCTRVYSRKQFFLWYLLIENSLWLCRNLICALAAIWLQNKRYLKLATDIDLEKKENKYKKNILHLS